jgi:Domain of unknown function (DUF4145)
MIHVPEDCPDAVKKELNLVFGLYWSDRSSCLNRIRNALELVLDDLKVPKRQRTRTGKMQSRTLHNRIEKLQTARPKLKEVCDQMMAVKHLGNAGSHSVLKVQLYDVFDGLDILERILNDTYSGHPAQLARAVKRINRKRGPG